MIQSKYFPGTLLLNVLLWRAGLQVSEDATFTLWATLSGGDVSGGVVNGVEMKMDLGCLHPIFQECSLIWMWTTQKFPHNVIYKKTQKQQMNALSYEVTRRKKKS